MCPKTVARERGMAWSGCMLSVFVELRLPCALSELSWKKRRLLVVYVLALEYTVSPIGKRIACPYHVWGQRTWAQRPRGTPQAETEMGRLDECSMSAAGGLPIRCAGLSSYTRTRRQALQSLLIGKRGLLA
jgi:hypothetical protein